MHAIRSPPPRGKTLSIAFSPNVYLKGDLTVKKSKNLREGHDSYLDKRIRRVYSRRARLEQRRKLYEIVHILDIQTMQEG